MTLPQPPLPLLLLASALVLLPFGRTAEMPMAVLSIAGFLALFSGPALREAERWPLLLGLYAAVALPMLLALPDAVAPGKSLRTTVGSLRYLLSCCGLLWLLQQSRQRALLQREVLEGLGVVSALLLAFWCLDGLLQFVSGENILGYGFSRGYINGVFGEDENFKFGLTVALLAPIALIHALRRWPAPAFWALFALIVVLVMLSGKRAAWIALAIECLAIVFYYLHRRRIRRRQLLGLGLLALLAAGSAYLSSDWVQQRSNVLLEAADQRDYASLNEASGKRLPIWSTALRMGREHWINGVGPRGFRYAYADFAREGDRWAAALSSGPGSRASHAHQLLLELLADTGIFGVAGYLLFVMLLWRAWRRADAAARHRALPFAVSLVGVLFPVNTHPAWYSSSAGLVMWWFIAVYLFALSGGESTGVSE